MPDTKTDLSSTSLSDDSGNPIKEGLSAKPNTGSHPAGAEPGLDTLFHRTTSHFCCGLRCQQNTQCAIQVRIPPEAISL